MSGDMPYNGKPYNARSSLSLSFLTVNEGAPHPSPRVCREARERQGVTAECGRECPSPSSTHGPEMTIRLRTRSKPRSPRFRHSPENSTRRP